MADYDLNNPELSGGGLLGGGGGSSSWLGNLFNFSGGRSTTADLYGDLFTKKQLAAIQQRKSQAKFGGLLNVLSQAAAPSKFKKDWGQILGQAGGAMLGSTAIGDAAAESALKGGLTAQQIAKLRREAELQGQISPIVLEYAKRFLRGGGGGGMPGAQPGAPSVPSPSAPAQPPPGPTPDAPPPGPVGQPPPFGRPSLPYGGPGGAQQPLPFGSGGGAPVLPTGGPPMQSTSFAPPGAPNPMLAGLLGGPTPPPFSPEEEGSLQPPDTFIPSGGGGLLDPDIVRLASAGGGSAGAPAADRLPVAPELVVIRSPSGARFSVAKAYQDKFQGLVNDLEAGGYALNPKTSGGYNPRYIAGTTTPSRHAHAEAIDVNWNENARGTRGKIPVELARAVAAKHGMTWGGDWKNPDDMHFEIPGYAPGGGRAPVGGQDEVIPSGRGLPASMLMRAQYAPGGGAPAAAGGVSDKIPGVGASPQELAALDMLAEMAGMKTPFKSLLDTYYKTPGYLGQATTAQEQAKLPFAGPNAAAIAGAQDPFVKGQATHSSQLQLFRELAAKGLTLVPDGKGGYVMQSIANAPEAMAAGDNAKLVEDQKKYQSYVKDQQMRGLPVLSEFDWDIQRRKSSSASTVINTTEGMEAAQTRARLAIDQKAAQEATEVAMAARRTMPLLDQVLELADKTPGGWAGPASATMAKAFSAVGIPVSEGMSNAELLQSIGQRLIPIVREPGATAAVEMDAYLRAVPGLMQSTEGRRKVADMTKAIAQRSIEIARVYRENVGAPNLYEKLAELDKPVFTPAQRSALETQPSITTPYGTITPVR